MVRIALVVVMFACSGGASSTPSTPVVTPKGTCEPGRCLPEISKMISSHRTEARACYDAQPGLKAGAIVINYEIGADGTVTDVSQSLQDDQITEPKVVDCVSGVVKAIKFAASGRAESVRGYHRFEFAPK